MSLKNLFIVLPVVVVFAIFGTTLYFDFTLLDQYEILDKEIITNSISEWFNTLVWNDRNQELYHRPFYNLIHTIDYSLWGNNPVGYHLSNIILHGINSILVYLLLNKLGVKYMMSVVIALLWCVIPIQAPVVALIHSKGDLLSTTFILACAHLFFSTRKEFHWLSSIFLLFALLTKEVAVAGFVLLIIFNYSKNLPWKNTIPLIIGLLIYVTLRVTSYPVGYEMDLFNVQRLATFPLVYGSYFFESLPGFRLGISDTVWAWNARETSDLLINVGMLIASIALQVFLWKKVPKSRLFILLFNIYLLPVAQIIPTLHFRSDSFLYIASLGWLGMLGMGIHHFVKSKIIKWLIFGATLIYFSFLTLSQLPKYKDNTSLFDSTLKMEPKNREALDFMGKLHLEVNDETEAAAYFTKALYKDPLMYSYVNRIDVMTQLGSIRMKNKQYAEASVLYESLSELQGEPVELDFNLGLCYKMMRQPQKAYQHFTRYQRKYPDDVLVMSKLAEVYVDLGKGQKAINELNRILSIQPNHPDKEFIKIAIEQLSVEFE